jgi:hypothetical protein
MASPRPVESSVWALVDDASAFPHDHIIESSCPERLQCAICLHPMEEPVSLHGCGHQFDETCLMRHMEVRGAGATCPKGNCAGKIDGFTKLPEIRSLIREMVRTCCICDGCEVEMTVDRLAAHVRQCPHSRQAPMHTFSNLRALLW